MAYCWQSDNWPNFKYDEKAVGEEYQKYLYQKGVSDALFSAMSENSRRMAVAQALSFEVVSSSEIEGVSFQYDTVFSSIAKQLDVKFENKAKYDKNAESVSRLVVDAMENPQSMTLERIFNWHRLLFEGVPKGFAPKVVGAFRNGPVYVIHNSQRKEEILYEGVPSERLNSEMETLVNFIQEDNIGNSLVKSAFVSLWFVSVHPFGDGNGRISRALADYVLCEKDRDNLRYFSISRSVSKNKKEYYDMLQTAQRNVDLDVTQWVCWFIRIVTESLSEAAEIFRSKLSTASIMAKLDPNLYNSRQLTMVYRLVDGSFFGKLTAEKWMKMTKCQSSTATRDLSDLVDKGLLTRLGDSGKNYQYVLNPDFKG